MSTKPIEALFTPYALGDLQLKNRIVMAPLTRIRANQRGEGAERVDGRHASNASTQRQIFWTETAATQD